jgi:cellulose synthase/poly-beta-1,6-N-acetylglucosamine synthase-like glycosyltransferase
MLFKKKALEEIGLFKENMLTEDIDASLNLTEKGWKVEQCWTPVKTYAPETLRGWWKQNLRWTGGGMQCFLKHPKTFLKNPLSILLLLSYGLLSFSALHTILSPGGINTITMLDRGLIYYTLSSLPYIAATIRNAKKFYEILYFIPFSLIYMPAFSFVSLVGFIYGGFKFFKLRKGGRGW